MESTFSAELGRTAFDCVIDSFGQASATEQADFIGQLGASIRAACASEDGATVQIEYLAYRLDDTGRNFVRRLAAHLDAEEPDDA